MDNDLSFIWGILGIFSSICIVCARYTKFCKERLNVYKAKDDDNNQVDQNEGEKGSSWGINSPSIVIKLSYSEMVTMRILSI
jgi:hypothetical protein